MRNYFVPQFFNPRACVIFAKFLKSQGEVSFKMFVSENIVEFDLPNYRIFIPKSILNDNYRFGKIPPENEKRLILSFSLSEEDLRKLINLLGGSIKKLSPPSSSPTLGDLLKL